MILEVCANSVQSAINANKAGADRIELCQNLNEGGTTPSNAAIKYCVNNLKLKTFVLIRPRTGDFYYSDIEYEIIKEDIRQCKALGVAGVVVGFLNKDYTVDKAKTTEIVSLAHPMEVTFHRAFDIVNQREQSLEDIIAYGCHRVLTSGFAKTADQGIEELAMLQKIAENRIIILAGSGVNSNNVTKIAEKTGIKEFHSSCKKMWKDPSYSSQKEYLDTSNIEYWETDQGEVEKILQVLSM